VAEQISGIEAEFTLLKAKGPASGMRAAPRYRCPLATLGRIHFPACDTSEEAWIHDLSKVGAGLILERPLDAGEAVNLKLRGENGVLVDIAATVIHSTPQVDGTWRVGCSFGRKLSSEERDLLL
jgi:hypothetical protein